MIRKSGKRFFLMPMCLMLVFLLSSCSQGTVSVTGKGGITASEVPTVQSSGLTKEQMLEDYDAMWKEIDENYALMGVAERTTGKNFSKIKTQYREKVQSLQSDIGYYNVIIACINEFSGCGHFCVLNRDMYAYDMYVYQRTSDDQHCSYLYNILNNSVSKSFYCYIPQNYDALVSAKSSQKNGVSGNIETKFLNSQTAYLQIQSFDDLCIQPDAPKISAFFQKIKNYHNCIIDIRGNGGGSEQYWISNIVMPNLRRQVSYTNYELVKGQASKKYLETNIKLKSISEFQSLPKTNMADLAKMQYYTADLRKYKPASKPIFDGKFYLLTDKAVYSSSDGFATFCKQSGFATIVGQATGGDGMGADPLIFALPHSGICVRFSAALGLNPDGGSNEEFGTEPDVPVKQGGDALEACMNLIQKNPSTK